MGDRNIVSGTVGAEADGSVSPEAGWQAVRASNRSSTTSPSFGGQSGDVMRVRIVETDIADADAVTAGFTRAGSHARPIGTLAAISALYSPDWT